MKCLKDLMVIYSLDKEEMIKSLYHIKKVFDRNNINFWLDAGTLLGAIREKKIIEWDDDIDICIWNTDLNKLIKIRNEIDKSKFELYIIPLHIFPFGFGHYGLRLKKNKKHVLCIFSCFVHNNNVVWMRTIPIIGNLLRFFHYRKNDFICSHIWNFIIRFDIYKIQKIRYSFSFIDGFKNIIFYDKSFKIPYNSESCLHSIYGNWKTSNKGEIKLDNR